MKLKKENEPKTDDEKGREKKKKKCVISNYY